MPSLFGMCVIYLVCKSMPYKLELLAFECSKDATEAPNVWHAFAIDAHARY